MLRYPEQILVGVRFDLRSRDLAGVAHRGQTHLDADGLLGQIHARVLNRKANRSNTVVVVIRWLAARRRGQAGERKESNLSRHLRQPPEFLTGLNWKDRPRRPAAG